MAALVATVFVTSLLGSVHCAGMCGPFVSFYAGSDAGRRTGLLWSHVAYNGGRLLTYVALGAVFGAAGSAVDRVGDLAGIGRLASIGVGAVMAAWGGYLLLQALNVGVPVRFAPAGLTRVVSRIYARLVGRPPMIRAALLGLFSTLLPCGWLYAFAVVAAGTGAATSGMAVMAVFWLGTLPIMAALGAGIQVALGPLRRHLPVLTAIALIAVGILALWGRGGVSALAAGDPATETSCPLHGAPEPDVRPGDD